MDYIFLMFVFFSFITGLASLRFAKPVISIVLILLLFLTFLLEFKLTFIKPTDFIKHHRNLFYNIFFLVEATSWSVIFYSVFENPKIKKFIFPVFAAVLVYSIVELCFIRNWNTINTDSRRLYSLVVMLLSISYLYSTFEYDYFDVFMEPKFYLCSGCVLFHGIMFVNLTTMAENNYWKGFGSSDIFHTLQEIANCLYYFLLCCYFVTYFYNHRRKQMGYFPGSSSLSVL